MISAATKIDDEITKQITEQQLRIITFLRAEYAAAEERGECMAGATVIDALQRVTGWTDAQVENALLY